MDLERYIQDLDREAFFRRLDYEWGKGLKHQVTRPDRCPDFRIITQPPPMHMFLVQWRKPGYNQHWQTVYSSTWHKPCKDYLTAYLHFFPTLRLRIKDLTPRSKQIGVQQIPKTCEPRLQCSNGELLPAKPKPRPTFDEIAWGELSGEGFNADDAPSASSLIPQYCDAYYNPKIAPRKRTDSAIATSVGAKPEIEPPMPRFYRWPERIPVW